MSLTTADQQQPVATAATTSIPAARKPSPIPSFTLQITKRNGDQVNAAAIALEECVERLKATPETVGSREDNKAKASTNGENTESPATKDDEADTKESSEKQQPLHELLYTAAQGCPHPLIAHYLDRVASLKVPSLEARLGLLLFHQADKTTKLRYCFSALDKEQLTVSDLQTLFRSILWALSCAVTTQQLVVVEGELEPPTKRTKRDTDTVSTKGMTEDHAELQSKSSISFDSVDDTALKKEVEEISVFAAQQVMEHAVDKPVDLVVFGDWYNGLGQQIVPWLELLQLSKWNLEKKPQEAAAPSTVPPPSLESPASLLTEASDSRAVLSFDFSDPHSPGTPLVVNIYEDNIVALRYLVERTGLSHITADDVYRSVFSMVPEGQSVLTKERFMSEYLRLFPSASYTALTPQEKEAFQEDFMEYFSVYEGLHDEDGKATTTVPEVNIRELTLGFCLFCSGNKSSKLALGFELLDTEQTGYLTEYQLLCYLKSYLSMLVATSFMTPLAKRQCRPKMTPERRKLMHDAVHRGAKWTLGYFMKSLPDEGTSGRFTFDSFANWYCVAGYNIAPWLELLDLKKVLPLAPDHETPLHLPPLHDIPLTEPRSRSMPRDRVSSLRRHHSGRRRGPAPEILFTFPLANGRSLVVLKEDATYVRQVVEQLGVLNVKPEQLWDAIASTVRRRRAKRKLDDGPDYVNMNTFVQCVMEICPKLSRKRSQPGESAPVFLSAGSTSEVLANFFQCFDLNQTDKVAIDELMGGLSLLCGGKKSTKLSFAFSIFDTRPGAHHKNSKLIHSLSGEDLFLFLRSILIITFSCCRQSLDMTDEMVGRCIADTANMICNDVMRYQWESKQLDRLDFDEFGQWYNDGGFERAPWLELLDLRKWVLVDNFDTLEKKVVSSSSSGELGTPSSLRLQADVPPPPPEDALDHAFFDENAIMQLDSVCNKLSSE